MEEESGGFLNIKDIFKGRKKANTPEEGKESPKEPSKKEIMLIEALNDIDKELEVLKIQKNKLEAKLNEVGEDITGTQVEESKLREQISNLVGKEGILDRKRNKLKEKLDELKGKIAKVSKIKDELSEVE